MTEYEWKSMNEIVDKLIENYTKECLNESTNSFECNEKCNKMFRDIQEQMLPKVGGKSKNKSTSAGVEPTKPPWLGIKSLGRCPLVCLLIYYFCLLWFVFKIIIRLLNLFFVFVEFTPTLSWGVVRLGRDGDACWNRVRRRRWCRRVQGIR